MGHQANSTCRLAHSPRENHVTANTTLNIYSTSWKVRQARGLKVPGMQKWMGRGHNLCKNVEVLATKAHEGPTWFNVKCVFGRNFNKSHHVCASKGKVNSRWRTETIPGVENFASIFLFLLLSFSHVSLFSGPHARAAAGRAADSTGRCLPWRSTPWCGLSCRSCRGCVRPRGSSLGCLLQTEGHHNPRETKTEGMEVILGSSGTNPASRAAITEAQTLLL